MCCSLKPVSSFIKQSKSNTTGSKTLEDFLVKVLLTQMVPLIFSYILMSLFKTCDHLTLSPPSLMASITRVYWMMYKYTYCVPHGHSTSVPEGGGRKSFPNTNSSTLK